MSSDIAASLRELRDALRRPSQDLDDFVFALSSTLQELHIHSTTITAGRPSPDVFAALERYLSPIQVALLTAAFPTLGHALDAKQKELLDSFFCPVKVNATQETIQLRRSIALSSYLAISSILSTKSPQTVALPPPSRSHTLDLLRRLATEYSIDELYWAVFGSGALRGGRGVTALKWEEAIKAATSLPGKVANVVGGWKREGWAGEVPHELIPKPFFDRLITRLEGLMYELSLSQDSESSESIRLVLQRLAALGLLQPATHDVTSRSPSLLGPLLPPLLSHLHPHSSSPLVPYPNAYLPTLLLALPTSILTNFVSSLLHHLTFRFDVSQHDLKADAADERIKRASHVLTRIIGEPVPGGEAWEAVMQCALDGRCQMGGMTVPDHARARMVACWVGRGRESAATSFIETLIEQWTDVKYIKYTLYARQLGLTHLLLLAISLLPTYDAFLISLSHRPRFLAAMQGYLSHPDPTIRRLGMLVAEIVSERTIEDTPEDPQHSQEDDLEDLKAGLEAEEEHGEGTKKKRKVRGLRRLKFGGGMWDGSGEGREACRWLRSGVGIRDGDAQLSKDPTVKAWMLGWDSPSAPTTDTHPPTKESLASRGRPPHPSVNKGKTAKPRSKIIMLDDPAQLADPLEGYASPSPSSSRSPSPTPSYLDEVAADPSLAVDASQTKIVKRPVYIQQLIELLKEREKPECVEMGLKWGEGLVRAKRNFGGELAENAVAVATMVIGLNDPFNLEDFDEQRQGLMIALVTCSPKNVAPALAELYFTGQYSLQQKTVILNSLAMGARELAGLPIPNPPKMRRKIDFPSKTLPSALHRRYVTPADIPQGALDSNTAEPDQIEQAISGVRDMMISKGARKGEETVPELARQKNLRVGARVQRTMVAEVGTLSDRQMSQRQQLPNGLYTAPHPAVVPFKDIAAEYFIMPLINRFWQHLQDAGIREARALRTGSNYRGAGTGMILSPMAVEKLLMTVGLLLHAARHATHFLAVLAPEGLELATRIGARHPLRPRIVGPGEDDETRQEVKQEAQVVSAALELALICLDTSFDLDQGRTLAMDKAELVLAAGEWAQGVFEAESGGGEVAAGQGGLREGRIRAASAGVVVKVAEIGDKWGRMGLGMMR